MKTRRFAASGLPALVLVAGLAALVPLAWLQYRWIGQVSEAERERAHAQLAAAANRFAQEFDDSIRRPLASMAFGRFGTPEPDLATELSRRYARWSQFASDPSIVRRIFLAEAGPAGPALSTYDPPTGKLEPAVWPPELELIRSALSSAARPGPPGEPFSPLADADVPVLIAPFEYARWARNEPPPPAPEAQPFRRRAWLILQLDLDTIRRDVLPPLFERAFPSPGEARYEALVVSHAHPDRIVFASDPTLPRAFFESPDARAAIFSLLPGVRRMREPEGGGRRGPPPGMFAGRGRPGPGGGGWDLLVKNRAGSLEQTVAATRRRNLAVSFGILLVMAASLATLVVSARRAQRLADLQMEFVAGVSHELKTPLAVICSAAENLADGVVGGEAQARRYGTVIRSEGKRLTRMVEQILAFAGIQRSRTKYELEPVEVPPILARAVALCDSERPGAGDRIDIEADPGLPLILADPISLAHCLRNLIENAIAHGGGQQRVAVRARAVNGVEIEVEDHGAGIDPGDLPNIFDPFFRGGRAVAEQVRGFGLGLTLVKHIVEAHSGTISVRSKPGEGTLFTVRIPAAAVPEPAREEG